MRLAAFEAVARALDAAQVRYLVAGGLAVNAHGYIRLTMDINLVIGLDADNIRQSFRALAEIGYRPSVPIDAETFARAEQRQRWREEKGIRMKQAAGRARDMDDIEHLRRIQEDSDDA